MLNFLKTSAKLVIILLVYAFCFFSQASTFFLSKSFAAEQEEASLTQEDLDNKSVEALQKSLLSSADSFEYKYEGRPDPFVPFISEAIVKAETKPPVEELTGMRRFEPGQLTLVAITNTEQGPLAMVQDSAGKGYIIRKGTKIGKSGEVADIITNTVIIKELTYTITKQKRYKTIKMSLKKEGEKQQ